MSTHLPVPARALAALALVLANATATLAAEPASDPESILRRYAEDYRSDPMLVEARFGIKVGEDWWNVASTKGTDGKPHEVVLASGQPTQPTWYFTIESAEYLRRLDRGEVTFGTLAGKARIGERTIDVKAGERLFVPPQAVNEFWNESATPLEGVLIIFGEGA